MSEWSRITKKQHIELESQSFSQGNCDLTSNEFGFGRMAPLSVFKNVTEKEKELEGEEEEEDFDLYYLLQSPRDDNNCSNDECSNNHTKEQAPTYVIYNML